MIPAFYAFLLYGAACFIMLIEGHIFDVLIERRTGTRSVYARGRERKEGRQKEKKEKKRRGG